MEHYILFIDDSGTKEYATGGQYTNNGNTRYFCFGGLLINNRDNAALGSRFAECKQQYFGTDNVEIKSNWLRIPKEREKRYLQKYSINEEDLKNFVHETYDIINETYVVLIAAVVDKQHMFEDYKDKAWYAPAVAYEVLLQRIVQEIKLPDVVFVNIDDMDGATPKGSQYKKNLQNHHNKMIRFGSSLQKGIKFDSLRSLRFVDSARSNQIQLADIIAYNVYRQFVKYGEEWEDVALENLPTYSWFNKLAGKFRQKNGRIQGFGIIKMPLRNRVLWRV